MSRTLFALALLVALAGWNSPASAQPYSGCGELINQPFGGCIALFMPLGSSDVYQLGGLGSAGFVTGDIVYVEGTLVTLCATFCSITACLDVTFISDCGTPFSECGTIAGDPSCYTLETPTGASYQLSSIGTYQVGDTVLVDGMLDPMCSSACASDGCILGPIFDACATTYVTGDNNDDGGVDVADAVTLLGQLFVPGTDPSTCVAAGDANGDDTVDISDGIYLLSFLFVPGSPSPASPFPDCGPADPGGLGCVLFSSCP